uniref:Uncharacterized protein n=1 Tax=Cacopsylla melanoneura TaxID=428564 RepID=A0A8D9AT62_9HEMI
MNETLKRLSCIFQAEGKNYKFKQTEGCDHSGLANVFRSHGNVMERSNKVNFRKYFLTAKLRVEVLNVRDRVTIRNSDSIESPIIPTGTPVTFFLRYHVKWTRPVALGRSTYSHLHHEMKFPLGTFQLIRRKATSLSSDRRTSGVNFVSGAVRVFAETRFFTKQIRVLLENVVVLVSWL